MRRSIARTGGRESARELAQTKLAQTKLAQTRLAHTRIAAAGWWCRARRRAARWMPPEWRQSPAMDFRRLALRVDATAEGTRRRLAARCEWRPELSRAASA